MSALHPSYQCQCQVPVPQTHLGEETGLCRACNGVYDEQLYELRLRQHTAGFVYEDLDEFLIAVDPGYRALVS